MKIVEMRCMLTSGLVWPSKLVRRAVRANRMHRKSSWRTSTKKIYNFDVGIWITQSVVCYSIRKSSKWGVCSLRGSFDLQNGSDGLWGTTRCIEKVLDGRPQIFFAFLTSKSRSPKQWFAIAHKNRRNGGYARFEARLTMKIGQTGRGGQLDA